MAEEKGRWLRVTAITAAAVAAAGAVAVLIVRDQMRRHQRNLFHASPFRRIAALEHLARQTGSIDLLNVLRDYIAWEPRSVLRNRAGVIQARMAEEVTAAADGLPTGESVG
jgi:hypothetical protein